jgi:hypothetical protein
VGPFFIESSLNQTKYQDGAIPYNARMNFVFLNHLHHFGERQMSVHGAIRWPARSPDLNPLDFFIYIQNFGDNVYLTPPGTQKELRKKIVRLCQEKLRNFLLQR